MSKVINGKELASQILDNIKVTIQKNQLKIKLVIIQVGNEEASNIYVRLKCKRAEEVGIETEILKFSESVTQQELEEKIEVLNQDKTITGFFIQTPIPKHLDLYRLTSLINAKKDVDGMNPLSLGMLFNNRRDVLVSATALACLEALRSIKAYELAGKHAVIVNRSTILGKPLAALLLNKDCTVTICHSKTQNLKEICKTADILVTGTGKENFITKDFVKEGAVVIDCGSPKPEVSEDVIDIAGYLTPVPNGIGPLTIACLLNNCIKDLNR